jgi:cell pole-organizing protein PopZ
MARTAILLQPQHADFRTTSVGGSLDDLCRSVLQIIAELSPCSEKKLFIVAVNRDLAGSRHLSLGDFEVRLHKSVQQLEERGLLKIHGGELVLTEPGNGPLEAQGDAALSPEPTNEEVVAPIRPTIADHETGQPKGQTETPHAQADECEGEADNQTIMQPGNGPLEAQGNTDRTLDPTMEEIVASIRQIITDFETGQANGQTADPQAEADEKVGSGINDVGRAPNCRDAAATVDEGEILDLQTELAGLETIDVYDQAMVEVTDAHENTDLEQLKPSTLEKALATSKAEQVSSSATLKTELSQFESAPQQAKPGIGHESSFDDQHESVLTREPEPGSELVLTETAEMMRDIVMALLLLALATLSVMSWFDGKRSGITVLMLFALLLVGSAVWGWRSLRR